MGMGSVAKQRTFPEDSRGAGTEDSLLVETVNSGNLSAELKPSDLYRAASRNPSGAMCCKTHDVATVIARPSLT